MNTSTLRAKEVTLPLLLVIVGSLLQSVLPGSETLEILLLSYLKNKWLMWELKVSTVALLVLCTYRMYLKHTGNSIDEDFLAQSHTLIFSKFDEDTKILSRKLRFEGRFNSTYGMNQLTEQIAGYVNEFLAQIKEHSVKIHGDNVLLDHQIKKQLDRYLEADLNFVKQKLALIFPGRAGSTFMANVIGESEIVIRRMYAEFALKMIRYE